MPDAASFPSVPLGSLDTVWFQVAGTVCNLRCTHCFISCSPTNHAHGMMTLAEVRAHLRECERLGVRDYYFTGGEPFLNPELLDMIAAALQQGPVCVLTNGILLRPPVAERLAALSAAAEYSLDLRISVDGWDAATNDAIRGAGAFERALAGIRCVAAAGLNPVITVTEACDGAGTAAGRSRLIESLRAMGLPQPRLKVMPLLRIGAERERSRGYVAAETLRGRTLTAADTGALQCSSSRMVTASGVYVCPILLDAPSARMGAAIADTLRPFPLAHQACFTCHEEGLSCRT
jgi:molybdenum cofactor biosynthesis enzyme MoaA